jgi:tetratricopeptide (TPR) repeat protein
MKILRQRANPQILTMTVRQVFVCSVLILLTAIPYTFGQMAEPKDVDPRLLTILDLSLKAVHRAKAKDWNGALRYIDQAISLSSYDPKLMADNYAGRASIRMERKDFKKALADWTRAIKLDPNKPSHYYDRARTFVEIGELDRALADSQKALDLEPDNQVATQIRGEVHFARKEYDLAILDFNRSI